MEAAARVIQRLARSFLYRMKGKAFLLSYAKKKMRELKAMRRALTHEAATRRLRRHWRATRGEEAAEYHAAFTVQRAWHAKQGKSILMERIRARKEREERARIARQRWAVATISRFWLAVAGNLAMRARYLARKTMAEKQKEEERRRRETEAREREEAELLRQLEEQRARAAAAKAALSAEEQQVADDEARRMEEQMQKRMALLKAQKAFAEDPARAAKLVQRCFRLARAGLLLRREARLAAERLAYAKRMAELEAAAILVQNAWRKAQGRHMLNLRFGARRQAMAEEAERRRRDAAARVLQTAWRHKRSRDAFAARFALRRQLLEAKRMERAACVVQRAYRRASGKYAEWLKEQAEKRAREEAERLAREAAHACALLASAMRVQRANRRHARGVAMAERFRARKLLIAEEKRARAEDRAIRVTQKAYRRNQALRALALRCAARRALLDALQRHALEDESSRRIGAGSRHRRERRTLDARFRKKKRELEHARYEAWIAANANQIKRFVARSIAAYNEPIRAIARRGLEKKRREARDEREKKRLDRAKGVFEKYVIRKRDARLLELKFARRRAEMERLRRERERERAARVIQRSYWAYVDRLEIAARAEERRKKIELERRYREETAAAMVMQRFARHSNLRFLLNKRFVARRRTLDAFEEADRRVNRAKALQRDAVEAQEAAEDALDLMKLAGWKMGSDSVGTNYYYNWVTGESSWERPDGWEPPVADVWVKNTDQKGNVFYFNQVTQETAWFPPCAQCNRVEARKICFDCGSKNYCNDCFETVHNSEAAEPGFAGHRWKGADADKETLQTGERYCISCNVRASKEVCRICRDAYCHQCFKETHAVGSLVDHPTIPWDEYRKGWQEVKGRVEGEQTYYFHATTHQNTYEKPVELMLDDERAEHEQYLKWRAACEAHGKKIEKLQVELEKLQYEKDTKWYEDNQQKSKDQQELDELRALLMAKVDERNRKYKAFLAMLNPIKTYRERRRRLKQEREIYRKSLLLSAQDRAKVGLGPGKVSTTS